LLAKLVAIGAVGRKSAQLRLVRRLALKYFRIGMQEPFVSLAGLTVPKLTKRVRINRPDELMIEMLKLIELWCRQSARSTSERIVPATVCAVFTSILWAERI
jgi:hypothetical protein